MILAFVLLTFAILILADWLWRRERETLDQPEMQRRSPIFLRPEKSLTPIKDTGSRHFHPTHTWVQDVEGNAYIGFDDFVADFFKADVRVQDLPKVGDRIEQGTPIWRVGMGDRTVPQASPVSGEVAAINPALYLDTPLDASEVGRSWIVKLKPANLKREVANLFSTDHASKVNHLLRDEMVMELAHGAYLNDGGELAPGAVFQIENDQWQDLAKRFFPPFEA